MRYHEIVGEAVDAGAEREKIASANAAISDASQSYQTAIRKAHDKANAAKRKLNSPKPPSAPKPPVGPQGPG